MSVLQLPLKQMGRNPSEIIDPIDQISTLEKNNSEDLPQCSWKPPSAVVFGKRRSRCVVCTVSFLQQQEINQLYSRNMPCANNCFTTHETRISQNPFITLILRMVRDVSGDRAGKEGDRVFVRCSVEITKL